MVSPIALLGGTFNPIHYGHLRMALEVQEALQLPTIHFVPCHIPVHKTEPSITLEHRLNMLKLALQNQPTFLLDTCEIERATPSYMWYTLSALRAKWGPTAPLILIMGMDSFQGLHHWHQWEGLITQAHLVITSRPGYALPTTEPLKSFVNQHLTLDIQCLKDHPAGYIYYQKISHLDISSTFIRSQRKEGYNLHFLLPDQVINYLIEAKIYE